MTGIYHDICFFAKEIATRDLIHNELVPAQSWPVVRAEATTPWPSSSRVQPIQRIFTCLHTWMLRHGGQLSSNGAQNCDQRHSHDHHSQAIRFGNLRNAVWNDRGLKREVGDTDL